MKPTDAEKIAWLRENQVWFFSNGNYAYEILNLGFDPTIERLMKTMKFPNDEEEDDQ